METEPDRLLLAVECATKSCGETFLICSYCYQEPLYCSKCREKARTLQVKIAGKKYQESEKGRSNHRKRQKAYRERMKAGGVTHQVFCMAKVDSGKIEQPDAKQSFCSICGRAGKLIG